MEELPVPVPPRHKENSTSSQDSSTSQEVLKTDSGIEENVDPDGDLFDPSCNPDIPVEITFQDVSMAAYRIRGLRKTPCEKSNMSAQLGMNIYFKKEFLHHTGSFKERGVRNALVKLTAAQREKGVICASAGNHSQALAYHGTELNVPVHCVMPKTAPLMKIQNCINYGAHVLVEGSHIVEAKIVAMKIAKEKGLTYINGYDHPDIIAGAGTCGLEIMEQVADIDAIVVPVGGGGLISGLARAVKSLNPNVKVIGVETARCASFKQALKHGKPVSVKTSYSLADGLSVPLVGVNAVATAKGYVDEVVLVDEHSIALSILRLIEMEKAVVEGAGVVGLAAIISGHLDDYMGKTLVLPLTGGNIDTTVLGRCIERGLAADYRLVRFKVTVSDQPGGIAGLSSILRDLGVSIFDIMHERAWLKGDVSQVEVKCIVETRDKNHAIQLYHKLMEVYEDVVWPDPVVGKTTGRRASIVYM